MNLTAEQIQGWKMNNGAMSPNEFRALCDLALQTFRAEAEQEGGVLLNTTLGPSWFKGKPTNDTERMVFLFDMAFTDEHPERGDKLERIRRAIDTAIAGKPERATSKRSPCKKYEPQPFDKNTDLCATCWHPLLAHSRAGDEHNGQ